MTGKVLIVEDDQAMAVALRDGFEYEGYAVQVARDGAAGLRLASEKELDLIILDVMLPKVSGYDICKQLRGSGNDTPIIMLTARGQEIDKVLGLKIGADDYVTKPFSFMELMARVQALLRRAAKHTDSVESFRFGDVVVNFKKFEVTRGASLSSSRRASSKSSSTSSSAAASGHARPAARRRLGLRQLPADAHGRHAHRQAPPQDRGPPGDPRHIITVHRVGYKFMVRSDEQ